MSLAAGWGHFQRALIFGGLVSLVFFLLCLTVCGTLQVISLGAGKDSLFFRLMDRGIYPAGGYFEVDFPAVSTWKARLIAKTPILSDVANGQL